MLKTTLRCLLVASVLAGIVTVNVGAATAAPGHHERTVTEVVYSDTWLPGFYEQHWYTQIQHVEFDTKAPRDCGRYALDPCFQAGSVNWTKDYDPGIMLLDHWASPVDDSGTILTAGGDFIKWKSRTIKGYYRGCIAYQGSPICNNSNATCRIIIYATGATEAGCTHTG